MPSPATVETALEGAPETKLIALPGAIYERVHAFVVDRRSGNVILNIRDGQILKAVLEEHVKG